MEESPEFYFKLCKNVFNRIVDIHKQHYAFSKKIIQELISVIYRASKNYLYNFKCMYNFHHYYK